MQSVERPGFGLCLAIAAALVLAQAVILLVMGQPPICACGHVKLWHGVVLSSENSQHISDWYTFSHIIHGFVFYGLLWLVAPRASIGVRFLFALGVEIGWELIENSPIIIDRYRATALAQGYAGDSVINSVFDSLAMALGFLLARKWPVWVAAASAVAMEVAVATIIRDNLTLNIIQLIYPIAAISRWQAGG